MSSSMVLHTRLWIAAAFSLVYLWPNAFTITISLFILGGKQLGCSIIMHDTSHKSLFRTSVLNEFFGKWFGAYPVLNDMLRYRPYHVKHHVNTGLADDPDINLTTGYPSGKASIIRKFLRDLTGITAVKTTIALLMMHLNYLEYDQGNNPQKIDQRNRSWREFFSTAFRNLTGSILANVILFLILSIADPSAPSTKS